jgi:hypothetical protein
VIIKFDIGELQGRQHYNVRYDDDFIVIVRDEPTARQVIEIVNEPQLGRLPKDKQLYEEQKRQERTEAGERNAIGGKYGEAKTRYGLNRVMTQRSGTSESAIHLVFLVVNLKKRLRDLLSSFSAGAIFHNPVRLWD